MSHSRPTAVLAIALLSTGLWACQPADQAADGEMAGQPGSSDGVVEVTARDFAFEAPGEIPSGWTTFRMENAGQQEHFLYLYRLPDRVSFEQYRQEVLTPFDTVWANYSAGELDRAGTQAALGEAIAGWFFTGTEPSGGPALTEPGETSQATVHLEPGTYVMECYVKSPEGQWHGTLGMVKRLAVTEDSTGVSPPEADAELTLSNYAIQVSGELTSGTRTVAVHVQDDPDGFMKHDINLVRLAPDTDLQEIVDWMDWMDLEQFRAPAPGYSLGGVEHMSAGKTGYMTVELEPGDYAWVSEGYAERGMVERFTVE